MSTPYLCPSCKTNRSRFTIINQMPNYVKKDPGSGDITNTYERDMLDPFHIPYNGNSIRVQCGACGIIEDENSFVAMARNHPRSTNG